MTDLAKASISISYMPRFGFFAGELRKAWKEKIPSEARMIFSFHQSRRTALPNRGKMAIFAVRIEIQYEWSCKKLYGSDVRRHSWTIHVHAALYGRHGREIRQSVRA